MSFWIAVALLSAITLFFLAAPLWRKKEEEADRADYALNVFRDQLKELDKDQERGLISETEAETARIEIQRRLLAADDKRKKHAEGLGGLSLTTITVSSVCAVLLIGGSVVLYTKIGMPGYQDVPFASRDLQKERHNAQNKGMANEIAAMKERLQKDPQDVDGWMLLGRTLRTVDRHDEAVDAFRNAVRASERHPSVLADFAEAKVYAAQGGVDEEVLTVLEEAIKQDPMELKARFYLGYTKMRFEDYKGAVQAWVDLAAIAPPDVPWLQQVKDQIQQAAQVGGLNPADFEPSGQARVLGKQLKLEWETEQSHDHEGEEQKGPSSEDMAAASEMTPEEQAEMIRGMVQNLADRLKENPNDIEGWKRLAQAYMVLGEKDKAIEARNMIKELGGS